MIEVTPKIHLSEDEIAESFIRASGPGGQNVNKVETAVQLRFDAKSSSAIDRAVFVRLRGIAGQRMTRDGVIVITARRYRTQADNRRDALDRLVTLIRRAAEPPKKRKPTRPTKAAMRRRLEAKRHTSMIKRKRGRVTGEE